MQVYKTALVWEGFIKLKKRVFLCSEIVEKLVQVRVPKNKRVPFKETRIVGNDVYHTQWKLWEIYAGSRLIGTYFLGAEEQDSKEKKNYTRRYESRVLGKFHQGVADLNDENRNIYDNYYNGYTPIPTDTFHLVFGYHELPDMQSCQARTVFKRFDGHKDISFP